MAVGTAVALPQEYSGATRAALLQKSAREGWRTLAASTLPRRLLHADGTACAVGSIPSRDMCSEAKLWWSLGPSWMPLEQIKWCILAAGCRIARRRPPRRALGWPRWQHASVPVLRWRLLPRWDCHRRS